MVRFIITRTRSIRKYIVPSTGQINQSVELRAARRTERTADSGRSPAGEARQDLPVLEQRYYSASPFGAWMRGRPVQPPAGCCCWRRWNPCGWLALQESVRMPTASSPRRIAVCRRRIIRRGLPSAYGLGVDLPRRRTCDRRRTDGLRRRR
jgi:hypothetical protein